MEALLLDARAFLPLAFEAVDWDGNTLNLSGADWSFSTESAWRVTSDGKIVAGCWDADSRQVIEQLIGQLIVSIEAIPTKVSGDLALIFSGGRKVEIFATFASDAWVFRIPNGKIFAL